MASLMRPSSTTPAIGTPKPSITPAATAALQASRTGSELLSQIHYAEKYLKEKFPTSITFDALLDYLSLPQDLLAHKVTLKKALVANSHVAYTSASESASGRETFSYKPTHPVTNASELKQYLTRQPTAAGIPVKDLRDAWPTLQTPLLRLSAQHEVLLTLNKKDNTPRTVYADSPHLWPPKPIDERFVEFWGKCKVPANETEVRSVLEEAGIVPTSAVKEVRKILGGKKEKRRVQRQGARTTNTHMAGILKQYGRKMSSSVGELKLESTDIKTATGVELSKEQHTLVASVLDLFAGRPSLAKLQLWTDDAEFHDPITIAQGRKQFEAQWYGLQTAFSPSSANTTKSLPPSKILIHTKGDKIVKVEDKWDGKMPDSGIANAFRHLNSVTVPKFVSVPKNAEEDAKKGN
nr:hypothetical protein B0A51_17985 [Rachicladosporium sp. CCFEE 5018]